MNNKTVNEISKRVDGVYAEMHVIQNMLMTIRDQDSKPSIDNHLVMKVINIHHPLRIQSIFSKMRCLAVKIRITNNGFTDGYKLSMDYILLQSKDEHYCSFPKEKDIPDTRIKFLGSETMVLTFIVPKEISEFNILIRDLHGLRAIESISQ